MPILQAPVIRFPYPFILHAPDSHPDPAVQLVALAQTGGKRSGEGADGSTSHLVDLLDHLGVEVMTASGQRLDFHLEAFLRLATQADGAGRDVRAENIKPLTACGPMGFLRVERQPEVFLDTPCHRLEPPFRVARGSL